MLLTLHASKLFSRVTLFEATCKRHTKGNTREQVEERNEGFTFLCLTRSRFARHTKRKACSKAVFYKVSYKTAIGSLKGSIRTQITTYLCINFYGLTWERILPTPGALRDDTKMAERETSIPCTSQPHNSESRPQIRKIPDPEIQIGKIPDPGSRKTYWEPSIQPNV